MNREDIYTSIGDERDRQRAKWSGMHEWGIGDCSSREVGALVEYPHDTGALVRLAVLAEECGEVARSVLERDEVNLRTELVQVAAVAVAWLESL